MFRNVTRIVSFTAEVGDLLFTHVAFKNDDVSCIHGNTLKRLVPIFKADSQSKSDTPNLAKMSLKRGVPNQSITSD